MPWRGGTGFRPVIDRGREMPLATARSWCWCAARTGRLARRVGQLARIDFRGPARAGHPRSVSGADGNGKQSCRSSFLPRRRSSARRNNIAFHRQGVLASARSLFSAPVAMGIADQPAAIRPLDLPPVSTPINHAGQSGGFAVRLQRGLAPPPRPLTISREVVVVNGNLFIAGSCLSCQQKNFNELCESRDSFWTWQVSKDLIGNVLDFDRATCNTATQMRRPTIGLQEPPNGFWQFFATRE